LATFFSIFDYVHESMEENILVDNIHVAVAVVVDEDILVDNIHVAVEDILIRQ